MYKFSDRSLRNLAECHSDLQALAMFAIKFVDFTVITGYRDEEAQNMAFKGGYSKAKYPQSKHNRQPSDAFDFIPYPFKGWHDKEGFARIGNMMIGIGEMMKYYGMIESEFSYGGNWTKFKDYPHIERL
jgi:peptidoglycan LD-endopeptidase CwlK